MTKKSASRTARDEFKKNSHMWDELEANYQGLVESMKLPHTEVVKIYSEPLIQAMIPDKKETANAVRTLSSDVTTFNADLAKIHALHAGRKGGYTSDEDQDLGIQVFELYTGFHTRYQAIIMPAVIFLAEQAERAKLALLDHLAAEQAKNPNVITDVEVKQPTEVVAVEVPTGRITTDPDGNPLSEEDAAIANALFEKYPAPVGVPLGQAEPLDTVVPQVQEARLAIAEADVKPAEQTQSE